MNGILMKPDMIKAIVEGRKTVTRRALNPQPESDIVEMCNTIEPEHWQTIGRSYKWTEDCDTGAKIWKPRYQVGEVVYIKEAWRITSISDDFEELFINYGDGFENWKVVPDDLAMYYYNHYFKAKRRPSTLFMPAWAARYFIKITDVRDERTRDITFEDCLAEGIVHTTQWQNLDYIAPEPLHPECLSNEEADKEIDRGWTEYARQAYFALYDSINGKGAHEVNWDWVYSFKKSGREV